MQFICAYHKDHQFYEDDHKSIYSPCLESSGLFAVFNSEKNSIAALSYRKTMVRFHFDYLQGLLENSFAFY